MAEHKRQHYVPRCHLKPFSKDGKGDAINLLNIIRDKAVECAPVRGQCAKDYIYGQDLVLEKAFQRIEGEYARIVRVIQTNPGSTLVEDLDILRLFIAMQHARTETAMKRTHGFHLDLTDTIFDRASPARAAQRPNPPEDRDIMLSTMLMGTKSAAIFKDLKSCIFLNRTKTDFVTSDDPAVFTSRYYFQRLRSGNFGFASSGAMLMLPITPRALVMFYDGNVYCPPGKIDGCIEVIKERDVFAFNELQYLKAAQNIYFANFSHLAQIKSEFSRVRPRRPDSWFAMTVFVPDESAPVGIERYRPARDDEKRTARLSLVCASAIYPEPSIWPSVIAYRTKPLTYSNGSALGHVRRAEWLASGGIDREVGRHQRK